MSVPFEQRVTVPDHVMFRELDGEAVILDLASECYFGLDEVGTRMWITVTRSASIGDAFAELAGAYDVDRERLRADLDELLTELLQRGLVETRDA